MKDNKLAQMSMDFSVQIVNPVKELKSKRESVISNQIGRSATSIGANIDEAEYKSLSEQCASIRVMLIASCKTAKSKEQ